MVEHLSATTLEQIALGALDDAAAIQHCATCDLCAARLANEARLELALDELHAYRAAHRYFTPRRLFTHVTPVLLVAAAALLLLFIRRAPPLEVLPEPTLAPASVSSGATPVPNADEVIASLRPKFKQCIKGALQSGGAGGKVVLAATIAPDGAVTDVIILSNAGFPPDAATCLADAVRGARFTGAGTTTTLHIPVSFVAK